MPRATVSRVEVRIGQLRQLLPGSLRFSWQLLTYGTGLAGVVRVALGTSRPDG